MKKTISTILLAAVLATGLQAFSDPKPPMIVSTIDNIDIASSKNDPKPPM